MEYEYVLEYKPKESDVVCYEQYYFCSVSLAVIIFIIICYFVIVFTCCCRKKMCNYYNTKPSATVDATTCSNRLHVKGFSMSKILFLLLCLNVISRESCFVKAVDESSTSNNKNNNVKSHDERSCYYNEEGADSNNKVCRSEEDLLLEDNEEESEDQEEDEKEEELKWWHGLKLHDFRLKFQCHKIDRLAVHSASAWRTMRKAYVDVVGPEMSSIVMPVSSSMRSGFSKGISIKAKHVPQKGRGIITKKFIPKGTLVYSSTVQTAKFYRGNHFREFLASIRPQLACDVLQWAYVEDFSPPHKKDGNAQQQQRRQLAICVDLDEGSFCNDGGPSGNLGCNAELSQIADCKSNYFALRDIQAGEELECVYKQFVILSGWEHFGLE